jgi:hypothetical protein
LKRLLGTEKIIIGTIDEMFKFRLDDVKKERIESKDDFPLFLDIA